MIFSIDAKTLHGGLKVVSEVIEKRVTLPILENVRVTVTGEGKVTLAATDMDTDAEITLDALSVDTPGEVAVKAEDLRRFVANLKGDLDIKLADDGLHVQCRRAKAILPVLPASDFVITPLEVDAQPYVIEAKLLKTALESVAAAQSSEQTRYYLNGIYFEPGEGALTCTATDGHRLMTYEAALECPPQFEPVILPTKLVKLLIGLAGRYKADQVAMTGDGNRLRAEIGPEVVTGKLVDGQFPVWRNVLPKPEDGIKVTVVPSALTSAIGTVMAYADGKQTGVALRIGETAIDLQPVDANCRAQDRVDCEGAFEPGEMRLIGFQSGYMQQGLSALPSAGGALYIHKDDGKPMLLVAEGSALRQCIMPIRTGAWRGL